MAIWILNQGARQSNYQAIQQKVLSPTFQHNNSLKMELRNTLSQEPHKHLSVCDDHSLSNSDHDSQACGPLSCFGNMFSALCVPTPDVQVAVQTKDVLSERLAKLPGELRLDVITHLRETPSIMGGARSCCLQDYFDDFDEHREALERIPCLADVGSRYRSIYDQKCAPLIFIYEDARNGMFRDVIMRACGISDLPTKATLKPCGAHTVVQERHDCQSIIRPPPSILGANLASLSEVSICLEDSLTHFPTFLCLMSRAAFNDESRTTAVSTLNVHVIVRDKAAAERFWPRGFLWFGRNQPPYLRQTLSKFAVDMAYSTVMGANPYPKLRQINIHVFDFSNGSEDSSRHRWRWELGNGYLWSPANITWERGDSVRKYWRLRLPTIGLFGRKAYAQCRKLRRDTATAGS